MTGTTERFPNSRKRALGPLEILSRDPTLVRRELRWVGGRGVSGRA